MGYPCITDLPIYKGALLGTDCMRMLFVTSTRVGDAILSTGVLARLIEDNPGIRVTVACGPAAESLFRAVPGLDRIIVLHKMAGSLHWLYLWAQTVGTVWDVLVDLRNAPMTYIIPRRKAYRLTKTRDTGHRVRLIGRVLDRDATAPDPKIWLDDSVREKARTLIPDGGPVLAIGPTANWRAKQWRATSFAELARRLTASRGVLAGARVAVFGRDDERPMALPLLDSVPADRLLDLVGGLDLLTVAACIERADLYVGNDSGLMHLAAASGTPTLGLFGPSPVEQYAPWGSLCDVAQTRTSYETIFPDGFNPTKSDTLMDSLPVEDVEKAATALWQRAKDAAA